MGMKEGIMPGDSLELTVTLSGGEELDLGTIQARTMGAGDEDYGDMEGMDHDHAGHDHSDHAGHDHSGKDDEKENHKH